ncbi:ethionine resistance protein [Coemansia sp. RSA 1365]|nr:ethionine resistance protein [Coemansia sp. RSA 1365]
MINDIKASAVAPPVRDINTSESTSLLNSLPSAVTFKINKSDTNEPFFVVALKELYWLLSSSTLTTLTVVLQASIVFVNVLSVSHLGAKELAAMSISVTYLTIVVMAPLLGLATAMETFCSTAFTASKDKTTVGFHFQRGLFAMFIYTLTIVPLQWYSGSIMLMIGQDPYVAKLCSIYLRFTIMGALPWAAFEAYRCYLQAQGIMRAGTYTLIIVAPLHCINNFILVRDEVFGLGYTGAVIANILTDWALIIIIIIYMYLSPDTGTWGGWDKPFGTSYFGTNQLAGQAIMLNTVVIVTRFSLGLGFGTSARIGNLIGAAMPRKARIAGNVSLSVSALIGVLSLVFIAFCDNWWIPVYTSDPLVIYEIKKLKPVACLLLVSNGLNAIFSSILRGLGRQKISANTYLISFYACAVPISLYLAFYRHMEAVGLWLGLCIGVILSNIVQVIYIYMWIDWKDEVRLCLIRLHRSHGNTSHDESEASS